MRARTLEIQLPDDMPLTDALRLHNFVPDNHGTAGQHYIAWMQEHNGWDMAMGIRKEIFAHGFLQKAAGKPGNEQEEAKQRTLEDGNAYEDCWSYYGGETDDWDDETLEQKSKEIPWEEVIAVNVSAT